MARLDMTYYGDPVLRHEAQPVAESELGKDALRQLVEQMYETCREEQGAGLAAPQVGVSKRIFVVECAEFPEQPDDPVRRFVLINPELVSEEGSVESEEGCLSIPNITGIVRRARRVTVRGVDVEGEPLEVTADGLVSRCIQHELDHLDGILFIDRLSSLKRQLLKRQLEEIAAD